MSSKPMKPNKVRQMERLVDISRILSSKRDLSQLLQAIVDVVCELTRSEAASILLFDPSAGKLRFEAAPGFQRKTLRKMTVPLESSVAGWIFTNARPMVIQDASSDARVYREVDKTLKFQTESLLGVPLIVKQKPIGVIEAVNKVNHEHYTQDDLAILETLAAQAAIAIENMRLQARLKHANEELMRLEQMKSDFIAISSHELRTPLGLILGHATFLKEILSEDHQEQLDVIIRSAMRLKSIIEDMATIAHKEEGKSRVRRRYFSLGDLVQETVEKFQAQAQERGLQLASDIPENDPLKIEGDREKIALVLNNLIQNALTFTDREGQIGVKAEADSGWAKVFVVDTGIGIPEEEQDRIFERFYQVESHLTRKHGGMGLGLSIARAMVEMHNGQIWCESKEGMGSLFCFMLPINEDKASAAARVFRNS